jgi:DNA-binding transcriptional regulator GbsR (MarR family)
MSEINHDTRNKILAAISDEALTAKQIAQSLGYSTDMGIESCLRAMHRARLVKRVRMAGEYAPWQYMRAA